MEDIAPEGVEVAGSDQKTHGAHPEAICERGGGKSNDKDGDDAGDEDNERLGGDQVEEKPHNPCPESACRGAEITQPVDNDAEQETDDEEIRETCQEVRDYERAWSIETVSTLFHERSAVFEVCWNVSDSHERHESASEEDCVGEGLEICLRGVQSQPNGAHHDSQA